MTTEYDHNGTRYYSLGDVVPRAGLRWDTPQPGVRYGGNLWSFSDPEIANRGDSLLARTTVGATFAREGALFAMRSPHPGDHHDRVEYFVRVGAAPDGRLTEGEGSMSMGRIVPPRDSLLALSSEARATLASGPDLALAYAIGQLAIAPETKEA